MALQLLVFDCDGVILDSAGVKVDAFAATGKLFDADVAEWLVEAHREGPGISRHVLFERLYRTWYGRTILDAERQLLNGVFRSACHERLMQVRLVPGLLDTLASWKGRVPIYVCSGTPQEDLTEVLTARQLDTWFTGILGTPPDKTSLLASILAREDASPQATVMVGDSVTDLEASRCNDTRFYGCGSHMACQTPYWGNDLQGLSQWLEAIAAC